MSRNAQKCNNNCFLQTRLQHRQWELSTNNSPRRKIVLSKRFQRSHLSIWVTKLLNVTLQGHEVDISILLKFDWFRSIRWAKALIIWCMLLMMIIFFIKLKSLAPRVQILWASRKVRLRRKVIALATREICQNRHFTGYFHKASKFEKRGLNGRWYAKFWCPICLLLN